MKLLDWVARYYRNMWVYRNVRTLAEVAGATVLIAVTAAAASGAATGTTIYGCANTRTGALSVLLKSGAKCPSGTTALSWDTTGPAGPAGPSGQAGRPATPTAARCSTGEILLAAGSLANGLPADGQRLRINSRTEALYKLLGTRYGGNGKTTFALPDLRGAAPGGLTYSICVTGQH